MANNEYIFKDLVDIPELVELFEKFSQTTGFSTGLVDHTSNEILIGTGWRDICANFHRITPESVIHCKESNKTLIANLNTPGQININYCKNGLVDGVTPIIINGEHLANLFTGQIFFDPPDPERFKKQAAQYGFEEKAYLEALNKVPVVNETQFRTALEFLANIATMIATTGMNRLETIKTQEKLRSEVKERKVAEKNLRESEKYLQTIHDSMQVGLVMIDTASKKIVDVNPAAAKLIKASREELIGRECHHFICPRAEGECPILDDGQEIDNSERILLDVNSQEIPILKTATKLSMGDSQYLVETFVDIRERKQAEELLETLFESLVGTTEQDCFDKIVSGLCKWLGADCSIVGEIVSGSHIKALSMQLDGNKVIDFQYPLKNSPCETVTKEKTHIILDDVCAKYPKDKELQDLGAQGYIGTHLVDKKNKVIGLINVISRDKFHPPPNVLKVMEIIATKAALEIERKQNRIEKEELEIKLRQSYKMEAIGTLAGGIAHDFNNILSAIIGFGELIQLDFLEEDRSPVYIDEILKASKRAKDLVKQILTFSRQSEKTFGPIKLYQIVNESLKLLNASIPKTIEIRKNLVSRDGIIMADPTQIHQVIMNICTNAAQSMENDCGLLEVALEQVTETESAAQNSGFKSDSFMQLTIRDTGQGISPEIQEKIFDPYFTTKKVDRGSGMGLAVVHGIMKSHGGTITYESETGEGTTFKLLFPSIETEMEPESSAPDIIPTGREHILLVDDEAALVNAAKDLLEHIGYSVTVSTSSVEALDIFKARPNDFDLVITDQTMPNMTGIDLARVLMYIKPDIPIILCTGFSKQIDKTKAQSAGIKGFAMKPIALKEIAELIRAVLDEETSS